LHAAVSISLFSLHDSVVQEWPRGIGAIFLIAMGYGDSPREPARQPWRFALDCGI
jgi:hypothetical protein